jgi:aryl-alcohol dehydrogenase-like predicted oxidoreductase
MGCSSFSAFFSDLPSIESSSSSFWTVDTIPRNHPLVQEWINTIHYAITVAGINLVDTAPWYGHGISEVVLGWAFQKIIRTTTTTTTTRNNQQESHNKIPRSALIINTKVGRYEADPSRQFDFTYDTTIQSVQRSLHRMQCEYINVLQLHDPEFAPSLDMILQQTIPAMLECQRRGYCKALGITGFPLSVQYQILEAVAADPKLGGGGGGNNKNNNNIVFDQSLTYGHYNLHDTSLFDQPIATAISTQHVHDETTSPISFAQYCQTRGIAMMAAAPLSMGLLTHSNPPAWHPAPISLRRACQQAARICQRHHVNISHLAIKFAISNPQIPCTILGMKSISEVQTAIEIAKLFDSIDWETSTARDIFWNVLQENERTAWQEIYDPQHGPLATLTKDQCTWNGIEQVRQFWNHVDPTIPPSSTIQMWQKE